MSQRLVIILWAVAGILAAATLITKSGQSKANTNPTKLASGAVLLEKLPAKDIASVTIDNGEQSVTLKKNESAWTVADRGDYEANFSKLAGVIRDLKEVTVAQTMKAGPAFNKRFGMDHESKNEEDHGILVTFQDAAGNTLESVSIGKDTDSGSTNPMSPGSSGKYIRLGSEKEAIYTVNESFYSLSADPTDWLNPDFIRVTKIKSIDLATPNEDDVEGYTLTRENVTDDFTLQNPPQGRELDNSKVSSLKTLLSSARFDDVIPADEVESRKDSSKQRQLVINTFDGFRYLIKYAPEVVAEDDPTTTPGNYLVNIQVSADLKEEREKDKDESEEDAKAADEAHATELANLKEKLANEQAFADHWYLLPKWTLTNADKDVDEITKAIESEESEPTPGSSTDAAFKPGTNSAVSPPIMIPPRNNEDGSNNGDALQTLSDEDIDRIQKQNDQ